MSVSRLRAAALLLAGSLGLAACDEGYGYQGMAVGYGAPGYCDPRWGDCYRGGYGGYGYGYDDYEVNPWWGWYGDYYYPGIGFYVYDSGGNRYRWNDSTRRYWEGRRGNYQGRDWNDQRWQRWEGYRGQNGGNWNGANQGNWNRGSSGAGNWNRGAGQGTSSTRGNGNWSHGTGQGGNWSGGHRRH